MNLDNKDKLDPTEVKFECAVERGKFNGQSTQTQRIRD